VNETIVAFPNLTTGIGPPPQHAAFLLLRSKNISPAAPRSQRDVFGCRYVPVGMHGRISLLAIAAVLLCAPAASAGWTQIDDPAPPRPGDIVTRALTITVKGFLPYSDPKLIIRSSARTRSYGPVELLSSGELPDGGTALLVRKGLKLNEFPGRLVLLRVLPDARITRLWSRPGTSDAAMAVGPGGSIDVVRVGKDHPVHHVTGSVRRLSAEHRLNLRVHGPYITDVDVALRQRQLVLAATTPSRTHTAVFARGGKVLGSRELRGGGRVNLATAGSRVAAVVYDSGIEGEYGECVSDHGGGGTYAQRCSSPALGASAN